MLIFVEGMIGSGKSTTAQWVGDELSKTGKPARVFHEFAPDHPIRTKAVDAILADYPEPTARRTDMGADGFARDPSVYGLAQWNVLADRAGGPEAVIIESTLLQNAVQPLFAFGAPPEKVLERFRDICDHLAAVDPLLIYLRPTDTAAAISRIHDERGEPWSSWNLTSVSTYPWCRRRGLSGRSAVVELYREWENLVDRMLPVFPGRTLLLADPQADWTRAQAAISSALMGKEP